MATLAETGERIGIPTDLLEDLIELPVVAEALHSAAANPNWAPKSIWKGVGRPTIFEREKLKVEQLQMELVKRRELATRTTDGRIIPERHGSPISTGRLQKAETIARRRLQVIVKLSELMKRPHEPRAMKEMDDWVKAELEKAKGAGEL
jgi:hypothetical protein